MGCLKNRSQSRCAIGSMAVIGGRLGPICVNSICIDRNDEVQIKVMPGGYCVGYGEHRIATTLGSCVAACIRDPIAGVGGINHFMLPTGSDTEGWCADRATRYGFNAMEMLINEVMKLGGDKQRLEIKLFGGGHVLQDMSSDVGGRNVEFVRHYLKVEGYAVAAEDLGSDCSRRLVYDVRCGTALVKRVRADESRLVSQRDQSYIKNFNKESLEGEVELFE